MARAIRDTLKEKLYQELCLESRAYSRNNKNLYEWFGKYCVFERIRVQQGIAKEVQNVQK